MTLATELEVIKQTAKMAGLQTIEKFLLPIQEYLIKHKEENFFSETAIKAVFVRFTYDELADYYATNEDEFKSDFIFSRSGNSKVFNFVDGGFDYSFEEHGPVDIFSNSFSGVDITFIKSIVDDKELLKNIHNFICRNFCINNDDHYSITADSISLNLKCHRAPDYIYNRDLE